MLPRFGTVTADRAYLHRVLHPFAQEHQWSPADRTAEPYKGHNRLAGMSLFLQPGEISLFHFMWHLQSLILLLFVFDLSFVFFPLLETEQAVRWPESQTLQKKFCRLKRLLMTIQKAYEKHNSAQ